MAGKKKKEGSKRERAKKDEEKITRGVEKNKRIAEKAKFRKQVKRLREVTIRVTPKAKAERDGGPKAVIRSTQEETNARKRKAVKTKGRKKLASKAHVRREATIRVTPSVPKMIKAERMQARVEKARG